MMKQFKCVVPYLPPQFQYHFKHGYDAADPVKLCLALTGQNPFRACLNIDLSLSDTQTREI